MDRIICLVSESGGGKTTIAEELFNQNYNVMICNITREIRKKDFGTRKSNKEEFYNDIKNGNVLGSIMYLKELYWFKRDEKKQGSNICVGHPNMVKSIKENVKNTQIIVIYLKSDEEVRKMRMIKRYREANIKENTNFSERQYINGESYYIAEKRLKHDREAFKLIECNYVVDGNRPLNEVIRDVKEVIEKC